MVKVNFKLRDSALPKFDCRSELSFAIPLACSPVLSILTPSTSSNTFYISLANRLELSASSKMCAAFSDVHKRTSISQLLNPSPLANSPREGSPSSSSQTQGVSSAPPQNGGNGHSDGSAPGSSFPLRSASWGLGQGPKRTDGPDPSRPYHYTPFFEGVSPDTRAGRPKDNTGNITGPSGAWSEMPNMAYGTPVLAPVYSDERTGKSL